MTFHTGLTFDTLRGANNERLPRFKNAKGELSHSKTDGSDWTPLEWAGAVAGELGELANLIKKVRRGDLSLDEARAEIANECADVVIYLDILAAQCGVNLGRATAAKWNSTSAKLKIPMRIEGDEWHFTRDGERQLARRGGGAT